jgi:hypothetical protein
MLCACVYSQHTQRSHVLTHYALTQTVRASNASLAENVVKLLRQNQAQGQEKEKKVIFSKNAPKPLAPEKPIKPVRHMCEVSVCAHCRVRDALLVQSFSWLDYHPTEIARQMTLIEYDMYKNIKVFEFLGNGWARKDKEKRAPNILAMTRRFNNVSAWIQTQIWSV